MRLQEIIGILTNHLLLVMIVFGLCTGLFLVVRKMSDGKYGSLKKIIPLSLLIAYIVLVIGVTFLNRGESEYGRINLTLFQSYKEAWYQFDLRHWQFVIFNIFMFVPFGFLLPLVNRRFKKFIWLFFSALVFTLSIETGQYITRFGLFELDDIFNNTLGAILGYSLIMTIFSTIKKDWKRALVRITPMICVILTFVTIFTVYHLKEFGNLSIVAIERTDLSTTDIQNDIELSNEKKQVAIYKAPTLSKDDADQFIHDFFAQKALDASEMEVIRYDKEGVYWLRGEETYNVWLNYLDGSYSYADFSNVDEEVGRADTDEGTLVKLLLDMDIIVPDEAQFNRVDQGTYEWKVDQLSYDDRLLDGTLLIEYMGNGVIGRMKQRLITYERVRDVAIKSEQEAYEEVIQGKFIHSSSNQVIDLIHIVDVQIGYEIDSKGYYQPVYMFESEIDGHNQQILIPAM